MTPLLMAFQGEGDVAEAAESYAAWIRSQEGTVDSLLGEIAALCMFNGHYALAERYAEDALAAGQGKSNGLIYVWRAGGHLGETGDVTTTLPLLHEARRHNSADEIKRMLSQQVPFTEYADDERLQEVV